MGSEKMHVVSFNCASWSKTLTWMDRFPKICRGFSDWMERHEIDILCLQVSRSSHHPPMTPWIPYLLCKIPLWNRRVGS